MFWTPDDQTQTITFEVNFTELTEITCDMLFSTYLTGHYRGHLSKF